MAVILIVEDQKDVQKLLGMVLKRDDRKILHAFNADDGLVMAQTEQPDLILLDIMMPGEMDGMDLLHHIRKDDAMLAVKVLIVSARTQKKDFDEAKAAGANDYLTKPFQLEELKVRIDKLLSA